MKDEIEKILEIEDRLYDLRSRWLLGSPRMKALAEQEGSLLAKERRILLESLTPDERENVYYTVFIQG